MQSHGISENSRKIKSQNQSIRRQQSSTEEQPQSFEQEIMIKNIDSGSYQVFNVEEVDSVAQVKQSSLAETKISLWNSYWEQLSKTDAKLLRLVLNKDAVKLRKVLTEQPIQLNSYIYMDGWTLLHHAVISSTQQIVKLLIQHKINLNAPSNHMKRTPLHQAVLSNKINIVEILVKFQVDPNIQDIDGNTPVHYAAELSYYKVFQFLMKIPKKIDFTLKNHHEMSILQCIRDEKLYAIVQKSYPQVISQNQNLQNLQKRRVIKMADDTVINRYSKSDIIQKFLNFKKNYPHSQQIQANAYFTQSQKSDSSDQNRKKHILLGKKPSHWIQKKGNLIASQSVCLMKQSVLEFQELQNDQEQSLANYEILRFAGSGGFAEVFLARKKRSSKLFALKRINKSKVLENNLKRYVYSERNIMIKCHHPFIVQAYSMFQDQVYLYIAMEYCQCGDLEKIISKNGKFSQEDAKFYTAQIGLALQQIHSKNILFRDLKSSNVLICKDGYAKISDFGLAKQSMVSFSFLGSVQYLAPEMLVQNEMKQHTKSIDWYLFGVLIYELVSGKTPFYGEKQHILFKKIRQQKPIYPAYLSNECKSLLSKLLQKDPLKRLGSKSDFQEIKNEQWFKDIDFAKILKKQYPPKQVERTIKQSDLRKKIPIDDFKSNQKYQYFKLWNYVKEE